MLQSNNNQSIACAFIVIFTACIRLIADFEQEVILLEERVNRDRKFTRFEQAKITLFL